MPASALERCRADHRSRWGEPELIARAPGRVNLIGEHTDYNDGFTMPMALPFDTVIAASWDGDAENGDVVIASEGFGDVTIDPAGDPAGVPAWARFLSGAIHLMRDEGVAAGGWRGSVATDIPTGASLSSSAAIEVAVFTLLLGRAGLDWPPIRVAQLGQRVENEVIGIPSGIMDQFISAGAVEGSASLMDCRSLTLTPVPLPGDAVVAIMDTGTRRVLAEAAYGERRASCERAVAELGVEALRDATLDQLGGVSDPTDRRRAHHVVAENQRALDAADAMRRGDSAELGRLMSASHVSLRDDYEVSGPGLDAIVDTAMAAPGCLGARMTGGGFAGCAVALIDAGRSAEFSAAVLDGYSYDGHTARIWVCEPAGGAGLVSAD